MSWLDRTTGSNLRLIAGLWLTLMVFETGGQLAIKYAAVTLGAQGSGIHWLLTLLQAPWFIAAVLFNVVAFLVWMTLLRFHDLSLAVPVSSVCDVAVVIAATLVFAEPVSGLQVFGIMIIAAGIWLMTSDKPKSQVTPRSTTQSESPNE